MQPIRKFLIALDHSALDIELIDYAQFFVNISEVTDVHFMHEVQFNISSQMKNEFPNLEKETIEKRKKEITDVIGSHFNPNREIKTKLTVTSQSLRIKPLLKAIKASEIDMVMVGNKEPIHGGGTFTYSLARESPCHVLAVPIGSNAHLKRTNKIKKFLVPIDFSKHSKQALERAIFMASRVNNSIEIICQNVFTVPSGYHYSGKSREEFAKIMAVHAREEYDDFIRTIDTKDVKITPYFSQDINEDKTSDISDLAKKEQVHAIIMGSRKKTATALLLGSISEKLVKNEKNFPVLIVRKKGELESIFDLIRKL